MESIRIYKNDYGQPLPKIFLLIDGIIPMGFPVYAIDQQGNVLCGHASSSTSFAKSDIGFTSGRKHDIYNEKYPEGFELLWVDDPESETDADFKAAVAANCAMESDEQEGGNEPC